MLATKPLDIRPDHAEIIHKILKDNLEEGTYVFAFGSRANWTAKQSSDLDLAIDGFGEKLDRKIKSNLEDAFEESDLPYKVDVVDLNSVSESFREAIQDQLVRVLWDWEKSNLSELIELKRGFDLPKSKRAEGNIPVIASTGITGYHDSHKAKAPGVVIGRSGSIGGGQYIHEDYWPLNTTLWCADFKGNNPKYIYYLIKSIDFTAFNTGSGVPTLNRNHLTALPIQAPPLHEQKRIAEILSSLDNKIEINKQINKTLEEMAEALFKSWFIDFDPVRVKKAALEAGAGEKEANLAVMKFISSKTDEELEKFQNDYPEKYRKLEDVAKLFPAEFQDGELGEMPLGWRVGKLSEVAEFLNGIALQKFPPENDRDYLPVIKIRELKAGITSQTDKASKNIDLKYVINDGDILFSWSGSLEVVIWKYGKGALNQHLFKVTSNHYPKWFYYFWTVHHLPKFRAIASHKATTMGHIQRHHLDEAQVIIPDDEILRKLDKQTSLILEKIMLINQEIQSLALNHDQLLPRLMRGEITVRNY